MKKNLIVTLGFAAALSSQICLAQNNSQVSTEDLQEVVQTLQKDHRVNLLTKEIDGIKHTIVLHAKESREESTSVPNGLKAVAAAGLLNLSYAKAAFLYNTAINTFKFGHQRFYAKGLQGLANKGIERFVPSYALQLRTATYFTFGSVETVIIAYIGFQLAKEVMKPFFGNNYSFRWFNHYTSLTGDKPFKLAKAIDKDLVKTAQTSVNTVNLEFIDFKQVEPVLSILTSSSFGYTLETVDQI